MINKILDWIATTVLTIAAGAFVGFIGILIWTIAPVFWDWLLSFEEIPKPVYFLLGIAVFIWAVNRIDTRYWSKFKIKAIKEEHMHG